MDHLFVSQMLINENKSCLQESFSNIAEPKLTMAIQETTGPDDQQDAVVEYSRNQDNSNVNVDGN